MLTGFMTNLGDASVHKGVRATRVEKVIVIAVDRVVIWVKIQNSLLEVRPVEK